MHDLIARMKIKRQTRQLLFHPYPHRMTSVGKETCGLGGGREAGGPIACQSQRQQPARVPSYWSPGCDPFRVCTLWSTPRTALNLADARHAHSQHMSVVRRTLSLLVPIFMAPSLRCAAAPVLQLPCLLQPFPCLMMAVWADQVGHDGAWCGSPEPCYVVGGQCTSHVDVHEDGIELMNPTLVQSTILPGTLPNRSVGCTAS